jgi:hypothetical protein
MCCRDERFYARRKKRKFVLAHLLHLRCKMRHRSTVKNFGGENRIAVMRCVTVNYPLEIEKRRSKEGAMRIDQEGSSKKTSIKERIDALDWKAAAESLSARGYSITATLLAHDECDALIAFYNEEERFRNHIVMERYRFGIGDYKYFDNPLPENILDLRTWAYPHLARVANRWREMLRESAPKYPPDHAAFLEVCHRAGQNKPTPLMLHYEAGGYNCLHQDLYGEVSFPLQMVFPLGQAGRDWEGGEFILVEQQPRAQSRAEVVHANQGEAIIFTTRYRPVKGSRGFYRVNIKHGVSRVLRGTRYTLGIIFHDAK